MSTVLYYMQVSGLGPSQGQVAWFLRWHPVKNLHPSVFERYKNETYRIYGVLEKHLKTVEWVALDCITVADIANYPFLNLAPVVELSLSQFPNLDAYHKRLQALPSVWQALA
ncbi:glutathione S-transferase [Ramaria rubella]|nr:glutathione S-transferase [Ramaria rubella]